MSPEQESVYLSLMMEDGWSKLCLTSIVFMIIAVPVIYFVGLNFKEKELIKNAVSSKILKRTVKNN